MRERISDKKMTMQKDRKGVMGGYMEAEVEAENRKKEKGEEWKVARKKEGKRERQKIGKPE